VIGYWGGSCQRIERRRRELDKRFGRMSTDIDLAKEAKERIRVLGRWKLVNPLGRDGEAPEVGDYLVEFEIYNGLDRPLSGLDASLRLTGDWVLKDYDERPWPGGVEICRDLILGPDQTYRFPNSGRLFQLPTERVQNGGNITANWWIGDHEYSWSFYGSEEETYFIVRTPERQAAQAAAPPDRPTN
jgi:hypothetical protein